MSGVDAAALRAAPVRVVARPVGEEAYGHGEGALWTAPGTLAWVDLLAGRLLTRTVDAAGRLRVDGGRPLGEPLGVAAPRADGAGWIVGLGDGVALLDGAGGVAWLARPEAHAGGRVRMNDGGVDPAGRFWVGSMARDAAPGAGSLFRVGRDGACARVLEGLTIANGIGWSPDGTTMYHVDTPRRRIDRHAFDPADGSLGPREVHVDLTALEGDPDGLCVDEDGVVWVALWGGGAVVGLHPDGTVAGCVTMDARQPTRPSLEPGTGRMAVTSSPLDLSGRDAAPPAGRVWLADVPATGAAVRGWGAPSAA